MAANTITVADLAVVRDVEFVRAFDEGIRKLQEVLGITRKVRLAPGTALKIYETSGTLEDGTGIAEAEDIPVSKYQRTPADVAELSFSKWAKETSYEAIQKRGYKEAVRETDDEFVLDIQKGIRKQVYAFLKTGTGRTSGTTFQAALAQAWGQLHVKFEDNGSVTPVYFVNPLDAADYLGGATLTTQTGFGMTYVEDFLGLGRIIMATDVTKGQVWATAMQNVVMYYANAGSAEGFDFYSDETGLVGVHHETKYGNLTYRTYATSALTLFPEYLDRIVRSRIGKALTDMTVAELTALAAEEGVDITGKTTKDDILAALTEAGVA